MDFKLWQAKFDDIKWYDSILEGKDKCGTYDFCDKCNKEEKYPCAHAANRKYQGYVRVAVVYRRYK